MWTIKYICQQHCCPPSMKCAFGHHGSCIDEKKTQSKMMNRTTMTPCRHV